MSRILNITLPIRGHINGIMKLSHCLRSRGHEVLFAGMTDCQPIVSQCGYEFIPIFKDQFPLGFINQWLNGPTAFNSWKGSVRFYLDQRRMMIDHERFVSYLVQGGYKEFNKVVKGIAPDVLLVDLGLHAYWALLAYQTGIKSLYLSTIFPTVEDPAVPPFHSLLQPGRDPESHIKQAWNSYFRQRKLRARALQLVGIPDSINHIKELAKICDYPLDRLKTRTLLFPQLDFRVLVFCPEELQFPEALPRPDYQYVEASIDPDRIEPAFPWEKIQSDKTVIFVSLGSVAYNKIFFQNVIEAVSRQSNWQLIMNIGPTLTGADFQRVPDNAILVNSAPQLGLLRRVDAMINHGGIGSVKECIYFGVPQVVFPIGFDQPGAAMRVLYHKLGVVGSFYDANSDQIHSLLSQVLEDSGFKTRSQTMSEAFQRRERQQEGAIAIEHLIASGSSTINAKAFASES